MTETQFWCGNPRLILNYTEKFKTDQIRAQQTAWLIGAYVKQALSTTILVSGLADKSTQSKMPKFPEMPRYEQEVELSEERKKTERKRLEIYYKKFAEINNKKRG